MKDLKMQTSWVHQCQDEYRVAVQQLREQQPQNLFLKIIQTFIVQVFCGMTALCRLQAL